MKTIAKKKTHIAQVRAKNAAQLSEVCRLIGWTELGYCRHQFYEYQEMALEIARGYSERYHRKVLYSPMFRGFFNNEWELRNEKIFLPFAEDYWYDRWSMVEEYRHTHDHMILLADDDFKARLQYILTLI